MKDFKYFVWRSNEMCPYHAIRARGVSGFNAPDADDPRCIWRGDAMKEARRIAAERNRLIEAGKA